LKLQLDAFMQTRQGEVVMSQSRTLPDLLAFLDWMADKGLAPANTISSRKASSNKVLSALGAEETADVTLVDVDDAIRRFGVKHGQDYSPDSLQSYKSRLRTALDDFKAYCDNPVGFRPAGRSPVRAKSERSSTPKARVSTDPEPLAPRQPSFNVVPVGIRENVTVQIGNLPFDLTAEEARKIANVILAWGGALGTTS
jgi:hypothetical protein